MVAAADERAAGDRCETECVAAAAQLVELLRPDVSNHGQVAARGRRYWPNVRRSQVRSRRSARASEQLLARLAQAQHQAALGGDVAGLNVDMAQELQRSDSRLGSAQTAIKPRHGFRVVVEDFGRRSSTRSKAAGGSMKSGVSTSIAAPVRSRTAKMQRQKCPPRRRAGRRG